MLLFVPESERRRCLILSELRFVIKKKSQAMLALKIIVLSLHQVNGYEDVSLSSCAMWKFDSHEQFTYYPFVPLTYHYRVLKLR